MKRKVPQIEKEIWFEHLDGLFNEQIQFMMYNPTVIRVIHSNIETLVLHYAYLVHYDYMCHQLNCSTCVHLV